MLINFAGTMQAFLVEVFRTSIVIVVLFGSACELLNQTTATFANTFESL